MAVTVVTLQSCLTSKLQKIISDVGESREDRKFDCNVYLSLSIYINSSVITESYCILIEV